MIDRIQFKLEARRHRWASKAILRTPPVEPGDGRAIVFSQLCGRDFLMYLLAAKSFAHHTGLRDFAILDDGSLSQEQHALLRHHFRSLQITPISEVRSDAVPRGGTWERLLLAARLGEHAYIVQMDADTLTSGPLDTVVDCVARNTPFTITSEPDAQVIDIPQAARNARRYPSHLALLQFAAESKLECLYPAVASTYVRGCSGFTGLPAAPRYALVEEISRRMRAVMGERWSEWGTEQVTTNLLTANAPDLAILRAPVYASYDGHDLADETRFVHFMGTYRYTGTTYRRLAGTVIADLQGRTSSYSPATSPAQPPLEAFQQTTR